jgi:superfamily II DNA helicase RecQ
VSVNNFIGERNSGRRTRTWEHFGTTVPWLLCSATLPRHVKDEVLSSIKIKNPVEVVSDLDRPNCYYLASDAREP